MIDHEYNDSEKLSTHHNSHNLVRNPSEDRLGIKISRLEEKNIQIKAHNFNTACLVLNDADLQLSQ